MLREVKVRSIIAHDESRQVLDYSETCAENKYTLYQINPLYFYSMRIKFVCFTSYYRLESITPSYLWPHLKSSTLAFTVVTLLARDTIR